MDVLDEEMSVDDVVRFFEVVEEYGVEKVKFIGGELMFCVDFEEIIWWMLDLMETLFIINGMFFGDCVEDFVVVGFDCVNVL